MRVKSSGKVGVITCLIRPTQSCGASRAVPLSRVWSRKASKIPGFIRKPQVPKDGSGSSRPLPYRPKLSTTAPKPSVSNLVGKQRWFGLFGAGAIAACLGLWTASFIISNSSPAPVYCTGHEPVIPTGRPAIQSPVEFDSHLDKSEWRYGITKLRRRLASATRGHVLEVAMGTGRNMEFYDWAKITEAFVPQSERNKEKLRKTVWGTKSLDDVELQSFTGVDISAEMLDIGLRRLRMFVPHGVDSLPKRPSFAKLAAESGGSQVDLLDGKLRVIQDDAQQTLPKPPPGAAEKYDTIVQTFGLCSVRDPTQILVNMAALVRPDTGRIILLEHGRTWWGLANGLLDRAALGHFERFGCWWNRDIEQIIREAEKRIPGLEVVAFERPGWISFGTNIWVELRVRDLCSKAVKVKVEEPQGKTSEGWMGWFGGALSSPQPKGGDQKKDMN